MLTIKRTAAALVIGCITILNPVWAGETTYTGSGTYDTVRLLMPLSSGGAAITVSAKVTATITPSKSGFNFGRCTGLGHLSADEHVSTTVYCSFTETADDGFDIRADVRDGTGKVEIIGGSGKWKGATGTGTMQRTFAEGNRGSYEYEYKISTP